MKLKTLRKLEQTRELLREVIAETDYEARQMGGLQQSWDLIIEAIAQWYADQAVQTCEG